MKKNVYYGEYTLQHWIDLMLSGNVVLPKYQRKFVWSKDNIKKFIETLKEDYYVPPVTIGVVRADGVTQNLILDGQQRLSSILLACLNLFPQKPAAAAPAPAAADENDDVSETLEPIIDWRFDSLLSLGHNREDIIAKANPAQYENVNYGCSHSFFLKKRLGFSFIVPKTEDKTEQLKFYSTVFRNINILGTHLQKEESRKSLYFLDDQFEGIFNPEIGDYHVVLTGVNSKMDFVRYLSLLSDYVKAGRRDNNVAANYKSKMEIYYEEFIYSVVDGANSTIFGTFSSNFPDNNYATDVERLKNMLVGLDIKHSFTSIIELDVYMFGLIYLTLFQKQEIDVVRKDELKEALDRAFNTFKGDSSHKKSPSAQKHLRSRIKESISIYNRYAVQ